MALTLNLRHLETEPLELEGFILPEDLPMDGMDEVMKAELPIKYRLTAELLDGGILARGVVEMTLNCECVRCLRPFPYRMVLEDWVCHLALDGEEAEPVVNDLVDLTPHVREDIFLALPQHPVCSPECQGLSGDQVSHAGQPDQGGRPVEGTSAWAALDKLKLD